MTNERQEIKLRDELQGIIPILSWWEFARRYFNKSASWLYHKLNGIDPVTADDRAKLKESLLALSAEIKETAERL